METLYTGHIHGFPPPSNISSSYTNAWGYQGGLVALGVVLGSSVSLVGLAFAFITYSLFSDLRSLAGTTLLSLLGSLFMGQLLFVIGVGGIQDADLCISLSLALLFIKLTCLCWLCCCCHHALTVFKNNPNLKTEPEMKMGRTFAHYSSFCWGYPLIMVAVAFSFKYKEYEMEPDGVQVINQLINAVSITNRCWLMEGDGYLWGFLVPASVLIFCGYYLAAQCNGIIKIAAGLQVDMRTRSKMIKKRNLLIGLFIKLLSILTLVIFLGAIASFFKRYELWAIYSIAQGIQGILTAILVSCNCRVLRLYSAPRNKKAKKCNYTSLKEGEGGRYGYLSVTNPNYVEAPEYEQQDSLEDTSLVRLSYANDENFIDRSEYISTSPTEMVCGDMLSALPVKNLDRGPLPTSV